MRDRDTPLRLVRLWEKMLPEVYDTLDDLKDLNGSNGLHWPSFCDLPISAAHSLICKWFGLDPMAGSWRAAELTACYTWRKNKIIYSFDKDLSCALAEQADDFENTDILPADTLIHSPYSCTFIKTDIINGMAGFWYWIEYDVNTNVIELRVQFVAKNMEESFPLALHLLPGKTIQECFQDTLAECAKHMPLGIVEEPTDNDELALHYVLVALQFILYIVSENADIQDISPKEVTRARKKPGQILDKASEVKAKAVGVRIGNAIRKNRVSSHSSSRGGAGSTVRPHSRRGHWHHYWIGPKNGERSLILKWTAPTFIHQDAFRNDTVVVFPVKQ